MCAVALSSANAAAMPKFQITPSAWWQTAIALFIGRLMMHRNMAH
jgi:hypothetical protein